MSTKLEKVGISTSGKAATLLLAAWLASGCAHSVLYDENRDKQGQEAKKAVGEARLSDAIASLDKTFAEVAAREETSARERATDQFDRELRRVSRAPTLASRFGAAQGTDGLLTVVQNRLTALGMREPGDDQLKALRTQDVQRRARTSALEASLAEFLGVLGHRFESCAAIYAASADPSQKSETPSERLTAGVAAERRALVAPKFGALVQNCKALDETAANRDKLFEKDGLIMALYARVDAAEREIIAYEVRQSGARQELNRAIAALQAEQRDVAAPGERPKLQSLEERAKSLRELVQSIGKGASAFELSGAHVAAEEKLRRLEAILGSLAGMPGEGKVALSVDEQVSIAIVRDLPGLSDEADKLLKDAKKPRLVPFLAAIDHQKLVLQGFEAAQTAKRKQVDAIRNQLQASLKEAVALARVLQPLVKDKSWATRSISELDKTLKGPEKRDFYRALATYADEVQESRLEAALWRTREHAAQYEEGLQRSKSAAAQWDSLIDSIAAVLADYHAAGIKRADLAEFFKALGLVVIGIGVAQ